jgi:hypothetical protein
MQARCLLSSSADAAGNPEQGIKTENLFPLDAPEFAVRFRKGAKIFRHIFRRITAADWEAFWDSVIVEDATEDRGGAASVDQDTASLVLYARVIQRVEGYQTRDGRKPEELPSWPECVPLEHRLFAIGLLLESAGGIATDTIEIGADRASVSFVTVWDDNESSTTRQLFGVTHHFRAPTVDHRQRFLRAKSKVPSSRRALVSLYDQLVIHAEGYSVSGVPIAPEQLQSWMHFGHKLYAVAALLLSFDDHGPEPRKVKPVTLPPDLVGMKTAAPATRVETH